MSCGTQRNKLRRKVISYSKSITLDSVISHVLHIWCHFLCKNTLPDMHWRPSTCAQRRLSRQRNLQRKWTCLNTLQKTRTLPDSWKTTYSRFIRCYRPVQIMEDSAGNDTSRGVNACLFINATRPLNFSRISLFDLPPNDLTVQAIAFNSALSSSHQTELCQTRLKGTANGTNHGLTIRSLWRNTTEKIAEAM